MRQTQRRKLKEGKLKKEGLETEKGRAEAQKGGQGLRRGESEKDKN